MLGNPLADHDQYEKIRDIARGSYGSVVLAKDKATGEQVAVKFIECGQTIANNASAVEREILNHRKLEHPHIIFLESVFRVQTHLALVLEYASGGTLRRLMAQGPLPEKLARHLFQQLMLALDYCHQMGVATRDIKPENTLLAAPADGGSLPDLKLADFGYSKDENSQSLADTKLGTPAYFAPEILNLNPGASYDAKKTDLWACGVMLFEMMTGRLPFTRPEDDKLKHSQRNMKHMERLVSGDYAYPAGVSISSDCKDLIRLLLCVDPDDRASMRVVRRHPWVVKDLTPSAFRINAMLVKESMASPPSDQEVESIRAMLREAQTAASDAAGEGFTAVKHLSCDMETMFSQKYS